MHYKEILIYEFQEKELRGLSPNYHIHGSVNDLYIPTIGPSCSRIGRPIVGIHMKSAHRNMNVANSNFGLRPAQFPFWEYLLRIFGIVSLQCG